jgi:hypothetical protein
MTAPDAIDVPAWVTRRRRMTRYRRTAVSAPTAGPFTRMGALLDATPDEAQVEYLLGIVSYAFKKHMFGLPAVDAGPGVSVHNELVILWAPLAMRRSKSRTIDSAFADLTGHIRQMYQAGSDRRANGSRLIERYRGDLPRLLDFYLG